MELIMNINKHCWDGRGGPRGIVTHIWDRSFKPIKDAIEKGGCGKYKIVFERVADVTSEEAKESF
jgi:hypothetical protein